MERHIRLGVGHHRNRPGPNSMRPVFCPTPPLGSSTVPNNPFPPLSVRVWGDYACFTRPETKVERVTYPVMTPSAARGVLEAIFWKPEMVWTVVAIQVLKPIRYASIMRNEINHRQTVKTARGWQKGGGYDATSTQKPKNRTQRHALILRDVAYIIQAQIGLRDGVQGHLAKYRDQFRRRVETGRCFSRPYLGCREFSAFFGVPRPDDQPIDQTEDLGLMLLDIDYETTGQGHGTPRFYNAALEGGVLRVPDRFSETTL